MHYRRFALLTLLFLALACSGNKATRPAHIAAPDINVAVMNEIFFGSGSTAPVTIEVRIKNLATVPVTVRRIEIGSRTMTEWGLVRQSRMYKEEVPPGETKAITFFATAETITRNRSEPLSYETRVEFEAGGSRWQQFLHSVGTVAPR